MAEDNVRIPASFRDPSGFCFMESGVLYRQVNSVYKEHYDHLMISGLYERLVERKLLIPHVEVEGRTQLSDGCYRLICPELVPFLSFSYEWCFGQLKAAALATLAIQSESLDFGMTLKDANSFNIQFFNSNPTLIDTLSFEKYQEGRPWTAYKQFCEFFLGPLALMSQIDLGMNQLLRVHLNGIPLGLSSKLLPSRSLLNMGMLLHLHLHAKSQTKFANKPIKKRKGMGLMAMRGLIDNLTTCVVGLSAKKQNTEWGNYYEHTNYSDHAFESKKRIVSCFFESVKKPSVVWDLGANDGSFSRIVAGFGHQVISFDIDPIAVETNYSTVLRNSETNILPLLIDLINPSPSIGWACEERPSLFMRGSSDVVLALGLIHHLVISNNVPLEMVSSLFARITQYLIIEFVPKEDSQVQHLLRTREDIFPNYTLEQFKYVFGLDFHLEGQESVDDSSRTVLIMKKRA